MTNILINDVLTDVPEGAVAYKYADPAEDARWVSNVSEAAEIAAEDQSLIIWAVGRYLVAPITSADCNAINDDQPVIRTDDLATAERHANHGPHPFGCGILDTETKLLDVGYGFGVPCPDCGE